MQASTKRTRRHLASQCNWFICRYGILLPSASPPSSHSYSFCLQATHTLAQNSSTSNLKSVARVPVSSVPSPARSSKKLGYEGPGPQTRTAWPSSPVSFCSFSSLHSFRILPTFSRPGRLADIDSLLSLAIFPGYYTGRATHIHTKVFPEWTPLPNGTFKAGRLSHVGQFFFDDEVNLVIDKVRESLPAFSSRARG